MRTSAPTASRCWPNSAIACWKPSIPEAALNILRSSHRIDLLFTDVVLPGKSGRELADLAKELRPGLKVLFTTGYSRNAIVHQGRLDAGVQLISKPFTFEGLAARVRDLLDSTNT